MWLFALQLGVLNKKQNYGFNNGGIKNESRKEIYRMCTNNRNACIYLHYISQRSKLFKRRHRLRKKYVYRLFGRN